MESVDFVEYDMDFLNKSYSWLTDTEIKYLTNTPNISRESQQRWFSSLQNQSDYYIRGISFNNLPIGACGLKHITAIDGEYWGYIGVKDYWGKGIGKQMIDHIESYARSLDLLYIYLNVRKDNERAIRLYLSKGYEKIVENTDMIKMRKTL